MGMQPLAAGVILASRGLTTMSDARVHIAAWEAAGVIDVATGDRLRALEPLPTASASEVSPPLGQPPSAPVGATPGAAGIFGPAAGLGEAFGYLGTGFLLSAWSAFVVRNAGYGPDPSVRIGLGAATAAVVLAVLGVWLSAGDPRRRRAAGVAFVVSVAYVGSAVAAFTGPAHIDWPMAGVVVSLVAVTAAAISRLILPALLTQFGLLAWLTALAASLLIWVQERVVPGGDFGSFSTAPEPIDPLSLLVGHAVWWLTFALLLGLIALVESRNADRDVRATRRVALTRFWAGVTGVLGLTEAVSRSHFTAGFEYRRVLEPAIGDAAIIAFCAVLIERAFRREASSFIYPAALGLTIALTDLNFTYVSTSTEVGLTIEGAILLAAGVAAATLHRRVGRPRADGSAPGASPAEDAQLASGIAAADPET